MIPYLVREQYIDPETWLGHELAGLVDCHHVMPWGVVCDVALSLIAKWSPPFKHQEWRDKFAEAIEKKQRKENP